MRKAVIDVGSNSVLLAVEEQGEEGWKPIIERSDVTSLGEGTKETGLLSEGGMARTLEALARDFAIAREQGCGQIIAAATMAARIARNSAEFLSLAANQETPVIILSGEQEAELGFRAVADDPTLHRGDRISIIDVGGQSTELVTADRQQPGWDVKFRRSFSIGTLGLRGSVLKDEAPGPGAILSAICEIDEAIGICYLPNQVGSAITLGATGTNLVTIREGMVEWDPSRVHGAWLGYEEISTAAGRLCAMTDAERRAVPGMEPGREKTLHIGALILERFLHAIHGTGCAVSVRGWRHALLEQGLPMSS